VLFLIRRSVASVSSVLDLLHFNYHLKSRDRFSVGGSMRVVPFSTILQLLARGAFSPGVGPWMASTVAPINAVFLGSTPVSQIPAGPYTIYLIKGASASITNFDIY